MFNVICEFLLWSLFQVLMCVCWIVLETSIQSESGFSFCYFLIFHSVDRVSVFGLFIYSKCLVTAIYFKKLLFSVWSEKSRKLVLRIQQKKFTVKSESGIINLALYLNMFLH